MTCKDFFVGKKQETCLKHCLLIVYSLHSRVIKYAERAKKVALFCISLPYLKTSIQFKSICILLIIHQKISCGYSLKAPLQTTCIQLRYTSAYTSAQSDQVLCIFTCRTI